MPIYEFRCRRCGRLSAILTKAVGASYEARCRHCGSQEISRLVSTFAVHKSEATILAEHGSEPRSLEDYRDPRQIGRWAERRLQEMGMELPQQAREMIQAAREGELPEPIDQL